MVSTFQNACGSESGFTLWVTHQQTGERFQRSYQLPFVVVGRNPKADLCLNDPQVNWRHAYLQMIAGRLMCIDLGSMTGVYWEKDRQQCGWLAEENGIQIGPYQIKQAREPAVGNSQTLPPARLLTNSSNGHQRSNYTLSFGHLARPDKVLEDLWQLDRMITLVGKTPECKIRFRNDTRVSSYHCCLLQMNQNLWVIDLLSRTGIELNGVRIRWSEVRASDQLKVGQYLIHVHQGESQPPHSDQTVLPAEPKLQKDSPFVLSPVSSETVADPFRAGGHPLRSPLVVEEGYLDDGSSSSDSFSEPQSEFWRSLLTPLFQQFSVMQQQMFDQFQNTLLMVTQTLTMQQEHQFSQIREELGYLRELNQELAFLHTELAKQKAVGITSSSNQNPAPGLAGTDEGFRSASFSQDPRGSHKSAPKEREKPLSLETTEEDRRSQDESDWNMKDDRTEAPSQPEEAPLPPPESDEQENSAKAPSPESDPEEIHRQMTQRLQELQQKRQSLWERILQKLTGH